MDLAKIFSGILPGNDNYNKDKAEKLEVPVINRECTLDEAADIIQTMGLEQINPDWIETMRKAAGGNKEKENECISVLEKVLKEANIKINGLGFAESARELFIHKYGLGVLHELRNDKTIDEIRVTPYGEVYVTRRGVNEKISLVLSEKERKDLTERLIPPDIVGRTLNFSVPTLEVAREDKTRLTALTRPVVDGIGFALRIADNLEINPQTFIDMKTLDKRTWDILSVSTKGRLNKLICGDVNTGKTTLLKALAGEFNDSISIRVIDFSNELMLHDLYPEREIWEVEVHDERGADLRKLFATVLRLTPDVIIIPEFRGVGEVDITLEAFTRGHHGSIVTAHFSADSNIKSILRNIAILAIKEGLNIPIEAIIEKAAQAFNLVIQTEADSITGVKKVVRITEVYAIDGEIIENKIVEWTPFSDNYWGDGEWKIINRFSDRSYNHLIKNGVKREEIDNLFK